MKKNKNKGPIQIRNRRATFDYFVIDTWTAGIELLGTEVKSIRSGKCNLTDSFCYFKNDELFIKGMEVTAGSNSYQHDPHREEKVTS